MPAPIPPDWFAIAGAVSGLVGAVTGIAGAIWGYLGYRHSNAIAALDLRVALKKQENDLQRLVENLPAHLELARKSRYAVAAATGSYQSGVMQRWVEVWSTDSATAKRMAESAHPPGDYASMSNGDLESKLITAHATMGDAQQLHAKYEATLADDDQRRAELRAAHS